MKSKTSIKRVVLLVMALLTMMSVSIAAYADSAGVSGELIIGQSFLVTGGHQPAAGAEFSYVLTYIGSNSGEQENESISAFSMEADDKEIIRFSFTHAGIYEYRLEQIVSDKLANYVYDDTVYSIYANVENIGDELKLGFTVLDQDGSKVDNITFENAYAVESTDDNHQTGDNLNVALYISAAVISALIIPVVLVLKKKVN